MLAARKNDYFQKYSKGVHVIEDQDNCRVIKKQPHHFDIYLFEGQAPF